MNLSRTDVVRYRVGKSIRRSENLFGETIVPFILESSPKAHRVRFRSVDRGFCVGLVFALIVDDPMIVMFFVL